MLSVVCWKWTSPGYRSDFSAVRVNTFASMVSRHYAGPHEVVCITDNPTGIDASVRIVPLWTDFRDIPSPHAGGHPSCYVRLKAFAPEMRELIGERFVSVDLDSVITGDMAPLWDRAEDFVIWRHALPRPGSNGPKNRINGSMWLMTAGAKPNVWTRFKGANSGREAYRAGFHGSDQGWMQYVLGIPPGWDHDDGVYSYKYQVVDQHKGQLPANARIVFFHGKPDPWEPEPQARAWVRQHYTREVVCPT